MGALVLISRRCIPKRKSAGKEGKKEFKSEIQLPYIPQTAFPWMSTAPTQWRKQDGPSTAAVADSMLHKLNAHTVAATHGKYVKDHNISTALSHYTKMCKMPILRSQHIVWAVASQVWHRHWCIYSRSLDVINEMIHIVFRSTQTSFAC